MKEFTPAFWKWFKDSVVTNEDGSPMVVYHGTTEDFTVFSAGEFGFHFGSKAAAGLFGDPVPYYLSIQNAFYIGRDLGDWKPEDMLRWLSSRMYRGPGTGISDADKSVILDEVAKLRKKNAAVLDQDDDMVAQRQAVYRVGAPVRATFKAFGFDGIKYKNEGEGGISWIAFDPGQVKLVGNDADDPDIRSNPEYSGEHGAPDHESGAPLWDVTRNGIYPADFYGPNGRRYYGIGDNSDATAFYLVDRFHNIPDGFLSIYRAIPDHLKGSGINRGDWVTVDRAYAKDHGESALNGKYRIIKKLVRPRDIFTAGDSILEWGYDPQEYDRDLNLKSKELRRSKQ